MKEFRIAAVRGRSKGEWFATEHQQSLEIGGEIANSLTSVAKDNYVYESRQSDSGGQHSR